MTTKKRMLVDASHPEETRIVVTSSNKLDEFDFESAARRQLRGNIYLAKVTRVEPSLQAAFVDYGGNRHGFLAFSEIHPDYFQIPKADRDALLVAEAEAAKIDAELSARAEEKARKAKKAKAAKATKAKAAESVAEEADLSEDEANPDKNSKESTTENQQPETLDQPVEETEVDSSSDDEKAESEETDTDETAEETNEETSEELTNENFDDLGGGEGDDLHEKRRKQVRRYKIQEVIKRGQVLLIQVVKEERGNKGAALTTYLSLAGRYSVLMPNTARGGGISRKITSGADRKRLKQIASDLEVPQGMGVILRTAGASRTKAEIKRDFEYLSRLWENVRQLTMKSTAPSLVYEEGSLIKRTIRDLYTKEISEVLVSGEQAYHEAKDFMNLIMPSHAKNVKQHKESQNLFSRYNVEAQLDSMFSPQVTLPSGGYIVINPTEALVSIDVNSGRATKEHNIEATALQTNLEAAEECARQFRLRDLAGLVVIDFIDMTERRSTRAVEKRLKEALKNDRARIQVGRISHFGLLEMSRQRMRSGVLESSTAACPTCEGTGIIRSSESRALMVMRAIEDHVVRKPGNSINVKAPAEVALYLLNAKRGSLLNLETAQKLTITICADASKTASEFAIERGERRQEIIQTPVTSISVDMPELSEADMAEETQERPKRNRGRRNNKPAAQNAENTSSEEANNDNRGSANENTATDGEQEDQPKKRRRRGRRGGRRNRRGPNSEVNGENTNEQNNQQEAPAQSLTDADQPKTDAPANVSDAPQPTAAAEQPTETVQESINESVNEPAKEASPVAAEEKPKRRRTRKPAKPKLDEAEAKGEATPAESAPEEEKAKPAKTRKPRVRKPKTEQPKAEASTGNKENTEKPAKAEKPAKPETPAKVEKPAKPAKSMPEEGVIVSSSNAEGEEKPKKKGWWARW